MLESDEPEFMHKIITITTKIIGGCLRIEVVARICGFETMFTIKRGEFWLYLTILIVKMGHNPLFRSKFSILGQPP